MDVRHPLNQLIASLLMGVMFLNPIVVQAAELVLDAAAGGNASLGQAANGVPLVNINTPNGSGLSHNKFSDYNVGQQGLILNNSSQALTPTQLGGYITGNPNLSGGAAGLILNEVTGSNASRLDGYTEVAGKAAHVIVANPHGITCDGCGFINTPKATLATGTPQIDNGALKGYDVNGGSIAIEGAGLNAGNVGQFELITRAAEINAEIHAQQLAIVTGRNQVDAQTLAATAKADDGSVKPGVAIDSSALGGMYAGAIRLVGTEAGVGVKLAGDLAASGGDIQIDVNGQLTMARSAAAGNLDLKAQDITLQADTFAAGTATIDTSHLEVQESLAAGNRVNISAQTLANPGTIEAGVRADGSINGAGQLQLNGGAVNNSGALVSHGSLATDVQTLNNSGEVAVAGSAQLKANTLTNSGQVIVQQNLAIEAQQTHNEGTLGAAGSVRIDSTTLSNDSGLLFSGADMTLRSERLTNRQADILSMGALDIAGDDQGGRSQSLENISGTIESTGDMHLTVDQLLNRKERFAATQQRVSGKITLTGTDNCKGDHCEASYTLEERYAPQITEDSAAPMLVAGGDLSFAGERFENRLGSVSAGGHIQIDADQFFNIGAGGGRERQANYYIYDSDEIAYGAFLRNLKRYNAYNDPDSPSYDPQALSFESIAMGWQRGGGWVDTSGEALVNAVVQAGGAIQINASQTLENSVIRPEGSGGAHLNRQLPPDLAQRLVDPLALPGYGLPAGTGGLFRLNNDPGHRYLIESNPAFASLGSFLSSDYMLDLLGYSDDTTQLRLGDGLYEQRLIRESIIAHTGKRFLVDALASDEAQFRYLMDNGIASKEALNLSVGVALSSEQIAALTHEIVWMEERQVEGQKVLVPVLYLPHANDRLGPTGALIQGSDLSLNSGGGLHNSGTLRAGNLDIQAMAIANRGLAQADDRLSLLAMGDVRNSHGGILAGNAVEVVSLLGDLANERSVASNVGRDGGFSWRDDQVDSAARIEAGSDLLIDAGRDLRNIGGVISSDGSAGLYAGRDITLDAATEADNSRMLFKKAVLDKHQVTQHGGEVTVAGNLGVWAGRDLNVVASQVKAHGDIDLYADRDLTLTAAANVRESDFFRKSGGKTIKAETDKVRQQASVVEAGGRFNSISGADTHIVASHIVAGQEAYLYAGDSLYLDTAQNEDYSYFYKKKKSSGLFGSTKSTMFEASSSQAASSSIDAGSDVALVASKDIVARGAQLSSDEWVSLYAGRNILLDSTENSASQANAKSKSGLFSSKASHSSSEITDLTSTSLDGKNIELVADNDLTLRAAAVHAEKGIVLHAGRDISVSTSEQRQKFSQASKSSKLNWHLTDSLATNGSFTLEQTAKGAQSSTIEDVGSTLSGAHIDLSSGRDTAIEGSILVADGDIRISAVRDLAVLSGQTVDASNAAAQSKKTGEVGDWYQGATGVVSTKKSSDSKSLTQTGSQVASLGGNVQFKAGESYRQQASRVIAPQGDVDIDAKRVDVEAGYDLLSSRHKQSYSRTAIGGTVSVPIIDAVRSSGRVIDAADDVNDGRLQTLAGLSTAMSAQHAYNSAQTLADGNLTGIKISVNLSDNRSKSEGSQSGQNVVGSTISAGGDITVHASGAGADSHLNIVGSTLEAGRNVNLGAEGDLNLLSAQNTANQQGTNSSNGWSVGVGFGVGGQNGFTLDLAANRGRGVSEGLAVTHTNSQVRAGETVNLNSGGDTNIIGAVVNAEQVTATVDGDLNLASLQDIDNYKSTQENASVGVSLCVPPFCYGTSSSGSASFDQQKINSKYASVREQTGINTGDGGFQLEVAGNTDLRGAVIASSEQAVLLGRNSLTTGTLSYVDILNHAAGDASSSGISLSSEILSQGKYGIAKNMIRNTLYDSAAADDSIGRTSSAISSSVITITDEVAQLEMTGESAEQVVAGLRRDTEGAHMAARHMDIKRLADEAEAARIIKTAIYEESLRHSDDAYREMFLRSHPIYEVQRDENGKIAVDENGEPLVRELSQDEKYSLKPGKDGRVKVFDNGIFNDEEAAARYAAQMILGEDDTVYLLAFPPAGTWEAELMIAGYQKFMENDFWGLTNSTVETKNIIALYGKSGLDLSGHSRGSMTVGNAMESLKRTASGQDLLSGTDVWFFGPAYNSKKAAGLLYELSGGVRDTVYLQNHADDFVGSIIGGNPATFDAVPDGSYKFGEWLNMFGDSPTTHSCYGRAGKLCGETYGGSVTWEIRRE